jgi:hypothetical protein
MDDRPQSCVEWVRLAATELVNLAPGAIVCGGTTGARALQHATRLVRIATELARRNHGNPWRLPVSIAIPTAKDYPLRNFRA